MASLQILSGGAAQGLVSHLSAAFKAKTSLDIEGAFGAVGGMADRLRAGEPADIVILTQALVAKLGEEGLISPSTAKNLGVVETALAVRDADPPVAAPDQAALRRVLLESDAIYVPDTTASTAGAHVAKLLMQLGIASEVEPRLKIHPNGATAMRHLAQSGAQRPIGCTQSTEIIATPGVKLSGILPPGCELATTYTASVTTRAVRPQDARVLIGMLTAPDRHELRARAGFVEPTHT